MHPFEVQIGLFRWGNHNFNPNSNFKREHHQRNSSLQTSTSAWGRFKQAIHISSENGDFGTPERKNNRQGRNPMENSIAARKSWISNQTKFQPFLRRFFRWDPDARVVGRSNDLTRLGPHDEATFIGNPLNGGNRGIEEQL
ncbi:hypothetical protein AVEN_149675-1 [Araneus ventricosus]|uniref:Uncharacterized protein n=1 Tax=Araneus ventricosus TaxID=182803 RepID=A0A4Y2LSR4_ARAVE|nr:hypothetical protein AVEN_149675-1 [Araneus ventricosus]